VGPDANDDIAPLHDRMPVFLFPDEWDRWMHGSFDDVLAFQNRKFPSSLAELDRTSDLWVKKRTAAVGDLI
jgi:putative SOS response-associated peptidase YedK